MNIGIFILFLILFLTSYIFFKVIFTNVKIGKDSKKLFAAMLLGVNVWVVSILLTEIFFDSFPLNLWMSRLSFTSAGFIGLCYFLFSKSLSTESKEIKVYEYIVILASIFLMIVPLLSFVVADVHVNGNLLISTFGSLHSAWGFIFAFLFIYSTAINYRTIKNETNSTRKIQLIYIFIGSVISIFLTLVTNILIPSLGLGEIRYLGPLTLIFFIVFTYYSIIRYRFFSFKYIGQKLVYGSFLFVLIFLLLMVFVLILSEILVQKNSESTSFIVLSYSLAFLIIILIFEKYVEKGSNDIFFGSKQSHDQAQDELLNTLDKLISSEEIIDALKFYIFSVVGAESEVVILDKNIADLINSNSVQNQKEREILDQLHKTLVKTFMKGDLNESFFIRDDLVLNIIDEEEIESERSAIGYMINEKIQSIFPVKIEKNVVALIVLRDKKDYSSMSIEDIEFMKFASSLFGVALERSVLFTRVEAFSKTLQQKVDLATEDLNKKNKTLQDLRAKERDMIDIMGHELRTPLTIIKMKQSLLRQKAKNKPAEFTAEEFLKSDISIKQAVEREIELLETMLSSTKIDAGRMELNLTEVPLAPILESSAEAYQKEANDKKLQLMLYDLDTSISVFADQVRLGEVVDNLVSNAIKYTNEGKVEVCAEVQDDSVRVTVKDTGIGIPEEALKRLGEKFYRVGQYIDSGDDQNGDNNIVRPGGTGLGLYVAFRLIDMMGGTYKIDSEYGKWSTFSFTLPRYKGQKPQSGEKQKRNVFERLGMG